MRKYSGIGISAGMACGRLMIRRHPGDCLNRKPLSPAEEIQLFLTACEGLGRELDSRYEESVSRIGEKNAGIYKMHKLIAEDESLRKMIIEKISNGLCAEKAVSEAADNYSEKLSGLEDEYLRERAVDLREVSARLIQIMTHQNDEDELTEDGILLIDELWPGDISGKDRKHLLGIVTRKGSYHSHAAILARAFQIPVVISEEIPENSGMEVIIDGKTGELAFEPDDEMKRKYEQIIREEREKKEQLLSFQGEKCQSWNGHEIKVMANVISDMEIPELLTADADGVGLFRSEFLYLGREEPPTEEEQFQAYKNVIAAMKGKRVIIRTMDIGADKKVSYLPLQKEENPALGLRGVRVSFEFPDLFLTQLRAIYRASAFGNAALMLPMIVSTDEIALAKDYAAKAMQTLAEEGFAFDENLKLGIMIETPAAAIISDQLAKECDFFSIGTNDLMQYLFAADRQSQAVDNYANPHSTALLRLLEYTAANAHHAKIPVGICGELALDTGLYDFYRKIEMDELSVPPAQVSFVREAIGS